MALWVSEASCQYLPDGLKIFHNKHVCFEIGDVVSVMSDYNKFASSLLKHLDRRKATLISLEGGNFMKVYDAFICFQRYTKPSIQFVLYNLNTFTHQW